MKTNRRDFFQIMGAGVTGAGIVPLISLSACKVSGENTGSTNDEQILYIGDNIAVADSKYGKVRGFILRGIYQFRGIPYGADTSGRNRFMQPQKPESWEGIRPAVWWGNSAPQIMENRYANVYSSFTDHWNYDDVSEDCLKLNVWTPATDSKKRPVLVWFHGGGFTNGNGIEQDGYMGENLSRKGNIVFVSINHRLGPLGFSDFSAVGGENYKYSGNAGALDMVAALEWVKENIANFGGDPGNVTIMGQSGGGSKVCTVAAMPKASGLVHKAVALSGSSIRGVEKATAQKLGEYIFAEAGLKSTEIGKLQEMPWKEYILLANKVSRKFSQDNQESGLRARFAPVADEVNVPEGTFFTDKNDVSSNVPMIICSTFHEWGMSRSMPELEQISAEKAIELLKAGTGIRGGGLGEKTSAVYAAYLKAFPNAKPVEILTLISSNRQNVVATATAKANQPAPVYVAWFGWEPPLFDNRMRAFHCVDICFWFNNTDLMVTHTGGGARPRKLAEKMSDALLQFMKTGNPNCKSLPQWPNFSVEKGETMVLNDVCEVKNDPDRQGRELL